jgi:hypothetical protein
MPQRSSRPLWIAAAIVLFCAIALVTFLYRLQLKQAIQNEALQQRIIDLSDQIKQLETQIASSRSLQAEPSADHLLVSSPAFAIHGSANCQGTYTLQQQTSAPGTTKMTVQIGVYPIATVLVIPAGLEADIPSGFLRSFKMDDRTVYASFDRLGLGAYEAPGCSLSVKPN